MHEYLSSGDFANSRASLGSWVSAHQDLDPANLADPTDQFTAEVLPQNRRMLNVFKEAGYAVHHHFEDGVVAVSFDIRPTDQSKAVRVAREHRAESVSMHGLLHPASIAVIGASRRPASRSHQAPVLALTP